MTAIEEFREVRYIEKIGKYNFNNKYKCVVQRLYAVVAFRNESSLRNTVDLILIFILMWLRYSLDI